MQRSENWWQHLELPRVQRRLGKGETLFRRDTAVCKLFVLEQGKVRLERVLDDGSSVILHTGYSEEALAEASLFAERYHCDAIAETASLVIAFDKAELMAAVQRQPELALGLIERLALQVRDQRALTALRDVRSARQRVLQYLSMQAVDGQVVVEQSYMRLAAVLGLSHETLYRTLARLERERMIERSGRVIRLRPMPVTRSARPISGH